MKKVAWSGQGSVGQVRSSIGPQLATWNGLVYAAWKGITGDNWIYYASFNGQWSAQTKLLIPSTGGPSLSLFGNDLYMAWPGLISEAGNNSPIGPYQTGTYHLSYGLFDGGSEIETINTNAPNNLEIGDRVSMAEFQGKLYFAFRGRTGDDAIHWISLDDQGNWSAPGSLAGGGSAIGPTLAVFNNTLYAIWPGVAGDTGIYWASYDGSSSNWGKQAKISGVGTSGPVGLGALPDRLVAAWKGAEDDGIYCSILDGTNWLSQQPVSGIGSSIGPQLASYNGKLMAMWVGVPGDDSLWWATITAADS